MLRSVLHILFLLGVLLYQQQTRYRPHPLTLTAVWYAFGSLLILVETDVAVGTPFSLLTLQNMLIALFFVPPAFFAFKHARERRKGIWGPFGIYILLALLATALAAFVLARADIVTGA